METEHPCKLRRSQAIHKGSSDTGALTKRRDDGLFFSHGRSNRSVRAACAVRPALVPFMETLIRNDALLSEYNHSNNYDFSDRRL